jgi:hypothetical protein
VRPPRADFIEVFSLRAVFAIALGAYAGAASGCSAAAIELAPLAVHAAGAVTSSVLSAAANHAAESGDRKEDFVDKQQRCDNLEERSPNVIELRAEAEGQPMQWRQLSVNNITGDPMWAPAMDMGTPSVWRPVENLLKMSFTPALALPQRPGTSSYLAYAAAEPQTGDEQDQLTGLAADFGEHTGTFQWNNRPYQYAMVSKLPCFPIAQAMK